MSTPNHLAIQVRAPGSDGTAQLTVEAAANGFAGRSQAWFALGDVASFARELGAYPLDEARLPRLTGGVSRQLGGPYEELVGLTVRLVGNLGQIGIEVHLAQPWPPASPRPQQSVTLELRTTYEGLRRLGTDLAAAAGQGNGEARLDAEDLAGSPKP